MALLTFRLPFFLFNRTSLEVLGGSFNLNVNTLQITPAPFAHRNIFCGNRLFQNKYEMYEWMQEAIAQGITNPGEIHRYVRKKETSIHGG